MSQPHCYATRLVNPFVGLLQVVDNNFTRGLSRDGYHWEIQVQVERSTGGWGSLNRNQRELRFYRYAYWNPGEGVRRMPTDPSLPLEQMEAGCEIMTNLLQSDLLNQLPFTPEDLYELWLLDTQQMPLALLGSTTKKEQIPKIREQYWQAVSASLGIEDYAQRQGTPLEGLIRSHSGDRQWFLRGPSDTAVGLDYRCSAELAGRGLSLAAFPQLLVREEWNDPQAKQLMAQWIRKMAPWLLQLPGIDRHRRARLEQDACQNPEMVDVLHRLYPLVIDQQLIETTRVAAKLKMANH